MADRHSLLSTSFTEMSSSDKTVRIALLETAPSDAPGSMRRYADLLEAAMASLSRTGESGPIELVRVGLAPRTASLTRLPRRFRSWAHHLVILLRTLLLDKSEYDLFHVLDGSHGYIASWLPDQKVIVTAHDIIPWLQIRRKFPVPAPGRGAQWLIQRSLAGLSRARRILSVSSSTSSDLQQAGISPERIRLCHQAISLDWRPIAPGDASGTSTGIALPEDYIFHIGNNGFYKNRSGVLRVFAKLTGIDKLRLVMAGPPPNQELTDLSRELGIQDRVTFLSNPDDTELRRLYSGARLLLFPSYYEGFGWPPLEAMACGCPVVASNAGSLPEIVGDAGLTASPDDIDALAEHCRSILTSPELASRLSARGFEQVKHFTLEKMGRTVLQAYRQIYEYVQDDSKPLK